MEVYESKKSLFKSDFYFRALMHDDAGVPMLGARMKSWEIIPPQRYRSGRRRQRVRSASGPRRQRRARR